MKRIFSESTYSVIRLHSGSREHRDANIIDNVVYTPGPYVACKYDDEWHIGHIIERSDANGDVQINFMRRTENTRLSWPTRPDKCWVPFQHILSIVAAPEVEGTSARQYKLSKRDYDCIVRIYEQSE